MTWLAAEDDREQRHTTPGPPIGTRIWSALMAQLLRELHEPEPEGAAAIPKL